MNHNFNGNESHQQLNEMKWKIFWQKKKPTKSNQTKQNQSLKNQICWDKDNQIIKRGAREAAIPTGKNHNKEKSKKQKQIIISFQKCQTWNEIEKKIFSVKCLIAPTRDAAASHLPRPSTRLNVAGGKGRRKRCHLATDSGTRLRPSGPKWPLATVSWNTAPVSWLARWGTRFNRLFVWIIDWWRRQVKIFGILNTLFDF